MATWLLVLVVTVGFITVINDLMRIRDLLRDLRDKLAPPANVRPVRAGSE